MTEIEAIKRLGAAIIEHAVRDLQDKSTKSIEYENALKWIRNEDTSYELSFLQICEFLDLNSDYIKKFLAFHHGLNSVVCLKPQDLSLCNLPASARV